MRAPSFVIRCPPPASCPPPSQRVLNAESLKNAQSYMRSFVVHASAEALRLQHAAERLQEELGVATPPGS